MSKETGFAKLQREIANLASEYVKPAWEARKTGKQLDRPTDGAFGVLLEGFTEITNTIDALELIQILVGVAPPSNKRIKKDEYLRFLVGAYLQEVYIFQQRLAAYSTKLCRLYGRMDALEAIQAPITYGFEGIIQTRGMHVHARRYTDQRLDVLSSLALIGTFKTEFVEDLNFEYKLAQRHWRKTITENNAATRGFLDSYCDELFPLITRSGRLFLPLTSRVSGRQVRGTGA